MTPTRPLPCRRQTARIVTELQLEQLVLQLALQLHHGSVTRQAAAAAAALSGTTLFMMAIIGAATVSQILAYRILPSQENNSLARVARPGLSNPLRLHFLRP